MSEGLEVNVEIGLCTKEMAKENPIKDFEILIEEYKDKWSTQMYDYFKECLSIIKKDLKEKETQDNYIEMLEDRIDNLETSYLRNKKALEIIKKYGHFDFYTGELIVNVPNDKKDEYDSLKEVLDYGR